MVTDAALAVPVVDLAATVAVVLVDRAAATVAVALVAPPAVMTALRRQRLQPRHPQLSKVPFNPFQHPALI